MLHVDEKSAHPKTYRRNGQLRPVLSNRTRLVPNRGRLGDRMHPHGRRRDLQELSARLAFSPEKTAFLLRLLVNRGGLESPTR